MNKNLEKFLLVALGAVLSWLVSSGIINVEQSKVIESFVVDQIETQEVLDVEDIQLPEQSDLEFQPADQDELMKVGDEDLTWMQVSTE